jgi:hypothetical protein
MSRCAFFVSAPTVRFLRTVERLAALPHTQRRKIAAGVLAEIKPLLASRDLDELSNAARRFQDERWRLISSDVREITDIRFASVVVTEQWILARLELVRAVSPVEEVLAEKRYTAVERFIMDSISLDSFDIVELYPEQRRRARRRATAMTAA